jgi:hypothetical protein
MNEDNTKEVSFAVGKDLDDLKKNEIDLVEQGWQSEGPIIENEDGTLSRKMIKV